MNHYQKIPTEILLRAEQLRQGAQPILEEISVILNKYTNKWMVKGSLANNTMVWEDIDVSIQWEKDQLDDFFRLGRELADIQDVHGLKFNNEYVKRNQKGEGYYWGIDKYGSARFPSWKIDIWGVLEAIYRDDADYVAAIQSKMTEHKRELILLVKNAILNESHRTPPSSSIHIYDIVLNKNVDCPSTIFEELVNLKIIDAIPKGDWS